MSALAGALSEWTIPSVQFGHPVRPADGNHSRDAGTIRVPVRKRWVTPTANGGDAAAAWIPVLHHSSLSLRV